MGIFIYGDNKNVRGLEYSKKLFKKIRFKREYKNNEEIEEIYLVNKKVILNIEGEELFIKIIKIPKMKRKFIKKVVENEIFLRYGEDIIYNYEILEEKTNCFKVILYCSHLSGINILQNYNVKHSKVLKIDFIQNGIKEYYSNIVSKEKYMLIVQYREYIYFLKIHKNKLVFNKVTDMNEFDQDELKLEILSFLNSNLKYKNIYHANLENFNDVLNKFECKKLENIKIETLLKYVM